MTSQQAVDVVCGCADVRQAAILLTNTAYQRNSQDNITTMIVDLRAVQVTEGGLLARWKRSAEESERMEAEVRGWRGVVVPVRLGWMLSCFSSLSAMQDILLHVLYDTQMIDPSYRNQSYRNRPCGV